MKLRIGKDFTLPADAVTSTIVVYGGKGMGKTVLTSVLAEELAAAGQRFSIIDPMGVWWGLRYSGDGRGPGIEVLLLGGRHGDIPIEPTGGAVVADLVVDEHVNVVIDIHSAKDGKSWSQGQRIRFVTDYIKRLFERQGERRRPIMQIIDEAARFCPQKFIAGDRDVALCAGAIAQTVEEGRNVGIGVTLVAQRSARLNKDVAELADCMMAFRTVGPNSVQAIIDWLGEHVPKERWREMIEQLRKLPRGTVLLVSPGWLEYEGIVAIRMRHTFDSSATPDAGKEKKVKGEGATPNLAVYQQRMADTIERAEKDSPRALRARIAELERQRPVAAAPAAVVKGFAQEDVDAAYGKGFTDATKQHTQQLSALLGAARTGINEAVDKYLPQRVEAPFQVPPRPASSGGRYDVTVSTAPRRDRAPRPPGPPRGGPPPDANGSLDGTQQKILDAIAELEALSVAEPPKVQVAFMSGYTNLNSKGFKNAMGALRSSGMIIYPTSGAVALTDAGRANANVPERPRTDRELQERIVRMLGGANARIVEALVGVYPEAIQRDELGRRAGYSNTNSKGFKNAIGRLRTLGFIDYPTTGMVRADDILFLQR